MASMLSTVLSGVCVTMVFAIIAVDIVKVRAVKGTRIRYLAKTYEILLMGLFLPLNLILTCALIYEAETSFHKGFEALIGIVFFALYGRWLAMLINDGDDDWFNDQRKKLKRWIRNMRTTARLRPAVVTS